jgi:hypothetical protein
VGPRTTARSASIPISGPFLNEDEGEWDWKAPPFRIPDAIPQPPGNAKALFIAPFVLDPNEPNRILAGWLSLWRTEDAKAPNTISTGPSWQPIKAPIGGPGTKSEISALAVAIGDSDTVWVGHANCRPGGEERRVCSVRWIRAWQSLGDSGWRGELE